MTKRQRKETTRQHIGINCQDALTSQRDMLGATAVNHLMNNSQFAKRGRRT